jgi:pSer/pThr/pTyr-binding forkhead associated (FHA) protein
MAFIVVEKGNSEDVGKVFQLGTNTAVIGRATPETDPNIKILDDYVSRNHAEIRYHQGCFMLRDVGSTNGTEIDGQRIEPSRLYQLKHDSAIGLGIVQGKARIILRFKESHVTTRAPSGDLAEVVNVSWLSIDEEKKEVWVDGKLILLSRKEYDLLSFLNRKAGKVCSKDEIISEVWPEVQDPGAISDATVDQLIYRLRGKIELDMSKPGRVISKKGFGYMLSI